MRDANRPRILLLIPHLGGGGAERVAENLALSLNRSKYEIHIGLATGERSACADRPALENIHKLNASRIRFSALNLIKLIWQIQPSVILSGMAHLNLLTLLVRPALPKSTRVLVRQNGALSATLAAGQHPCLARLIYGFAYRRADLVICQSEAMKDEIQHEFHVDETRLAVLPNPVDCELIRRIIHRADDVPQRVGPYLIAIGRLVPEKGFDILLEAFGVLSSQFPEAKLLIAGSGPCEASLKEQSQRHGIANGVCFSGYVPNPATLFRRASLFVLSSRTEGIPNALLEAAAAGLPIVATPASAGLTELVGNQEGVWLANEISASALADALGAALASINPGRRYPHSWIKPFNVARAIPAYEAAIDRALESTVR